MTCVNDEQPKKAESAIDVSFEFDISISFNFEQPRNEFLPIETKDDEFSNETVVNNEQLQKELSLISVTEDGIVTRSKDEQPSNTDVSIEVTEDGISTFFNNLQFLNVLGSIRIPFS